MHRFTFAVCRALCLALAAAAAAAFPALAAAPPGKGFTAANVGTESRRDTVERVRALYKAEQFSQLEQALQGLLGDEVRFATGDSKTAAAYWVIRLELSAPGLDPDEIKRIGKWKAQYPDSPFAELAECRYWYSMGWNARGTSYANQVGQGAWGTFGGNLRKAESCLMDARPALKATPLWHNLLLAISQDLDDPKNAPDAVLEEAAAKWPQYYEFYELRLTRLTPQWGGGVDAIERFISKWSTRQAKLEGDSLYARLYIWMESQGIPPAVTAAHWPRMKASLRELTARYPEPGFKNAFASYACRVGDAKQLRESLAALQPGEVDAAWWFEDAPLDSPKCSPPSRKAK